MANVLVTGAAGFIGSAVSARLATMGHRVVGCDNFNDYYPPRLKHERVAALLTPLGVECRDIELGDERQVQTLFASAAPTLVVHLAAQAGVRYSLKKPQAYVQSNLVAFGQMLEACRTHQIEHFVYASSSSVYGSNAKVPFCEDDVTDTPISLYAATKKSNELMAHSYSSLYQLAMTGMRLFTAYGPWGRPDMAYFSFADKMMAQQTIPVFAQGQLSRDFTYIDDVVESVVRLLFKPQPGGTQAPHAVFNVGNSNPRPLMEFIGILENALGVVANKQFLPMQPGDLSATYADVSKLQQWIDFTPSVSLETGLQEFAKWFRRWNAECPKPASEIRLEPRSNPYREVVAM
ncbi:UDP-glucuronate 4-epimerase [Duganella sp. 1411]|uniref:NAD-dependent epimerase/dehydratase family protein n=1 Tax=Duganella sp. 1411 TaxID=2806572 RepID=UPI001AE550F8|nr:NAD-dependent epimerase/dehydratase family protein [Duganella sp. 1411]MBP1205697.1 UDP-glucuronate 4-epimerase [Duganella sp. 1411]